MAEVKEVIGTLMYALMDELSVKSKGSNDRLRGGSNVKVARGVDGNDTHMIEIIYIPVSLDTLRISIWKDVRSIIVEVMDDFPGFEYSADLHDVEYNLLDLKLYVKFTLKRK